MNKLTISPIAEYTQQLKPLKDDKLQNLYVNYDPWKKTTYTICSNKQKKPCGHKPHTRV